MPTAFKMPTAFELIGTIRDIHHARTGHRCPECRVPAPCRTYRYVDGLLAARFEDPAPTAEDVLRASLEPASSHDG